MSSTNSYFPTNVDQAKDFFDLKVEKISGSYSHMVTMTVPSNMSWHLVNSLCGPCVKTELEDGKLSYAFEGTLSVNFSCRDGWCVLYFIGSKFSFWTSTNMSVA